MYLCGPRSLDEAGLKVDLKPREKGPNVVRRTNGHSHELWEKFWEFLDEFMFLSKF